jgi:hypothetical protein
MLVFIDESGDPGFKLDSGSSPVFVVAMVIFADREAALTTEQAIRDAKARLRVAKEFKFNSTSRLVREGFFKAVAGCHFRVRHRGGQDHHSLGQPQEQRNASTDFRRQIWRRGRPVAAAHRCQATDPSAELRATPAAQLGRKSPALPVACGPLISSRTGGGTIARSYRVIGWTRIPA